MESLLQTTTNNNNNNNNNKEEKYADLDGRYTFEPIAIETLGVFNTSARQLLCDKCKKLQFIHTVNGDGSKTAKIIKRQC